MLLIFPSECSPDLLCSGVRKFHLDLMQNLFLDSEEKTPPLFNFCVLYLILNKLDQRHNNWNPRNQ